MKKINIKESIVNNITKKEKKVAPNNDAPIKDKALLKAYAIHHILYMRMDNAFDEMNKITTVDKQQIAIIALELIAISKEMKYLERKFRIGNIADYSTLTLQFNVLNNKIHHTTNLVNEYIAYSSKS
jgi:hypothetical protein